MIDESKICQSALKQFLSEKNFSFEFDPEIYAQILRENGFLNYFLNRLLHSYETLAERQRIFIEWFPEFGIPGIRFLSDCLRQSNLTICADVLDSCIFEAEKQTCKKILTGLIAAHDFTQEEMIAISGCLLANEAIYRGDFDRVRQSIKNFAIRILITSSNSAVHKIFIDVVSNSGIGGLHKLADFLSSKNDFNHCGDLVMSLRQGMVHKSRDRNMYLSAKTHDDPFKRVLCSTEIGTFQIESLERIVSESPADLFSPFPPATDSQIIAARYSRVETDSISSGVYSVDSKRTAGDCEGSSNSLSPMRSATPSGSAGRSYFSGGTISKEIAELDNMDDDIELGSLNREKNQTLDETRRGSSKTRKTKCL